MTFREAALGGANGANARPSSFLRLTRLPPTLNGAQTEAAPYNIVAQGQATALQLVNDLYDYPTVSGYPVGSWELRSFATGLVVKTGGAIAAGGTWTATADLLCGAYRLYLFSNGSAQYQGGGTLIVTRNVAGMPTTPPDKQLESVTLAVKTMIGARRLSVPNAYAPTADAAKAHLEVDYINAHWKTTDAARPKKTLLNFGETVTDAAASSAIRALVTDFASKVDVFEGRNEPGGVPNSGYLSEAQQFYTDVKAVAPSRLVASGAPVSIGPGARDALRSFYGAGGGNYTDVIGFHTYNAHLGDLDAGRRSWDSFVAVLTEYGLHTKPRINTEAASFFAAEYGAGNYLRQAVQAMLDLLLNEQYGVQKEDWYYFYPRDFGFDSYPSHAATLTEQPFPLIGCLLTHSQELIGCTFEARLDFGTIDNDYVIGSRYRRADGTGVTSLMSPGKRNHPVTLQVTGGSPTSLVTVDTWGNQSSVTVTGGLAHVTTGTLPMYVRMPAGVTLAPTGGNTRWGTKRTGSAVAYVGTKNLPADGSAGAATLAGVLNGALQNRLPYDTGNNSDALSVWNSSATVTAGNPRTLTVEFGSSQPVDTLLVHCPPPWQDKLTVILDADVQALGSDGTTWTTVATINAVPTIVQIGSSRQDGANSWWDSYWDDQHVFEVPFTRTTTTALRLVIRAVSYGGTPTLAAYNAYGATDSAGQPVTAGMGTTTPQIALQRLAAYDSGVTGTPPPGLPPGIVGTGKYVVAAGSL